MNPFTVYMCVDGTLSLELNEVIWKRDTPLIPVTYAL
jgi:hypothetical protein